MDFDIGIEDVGLMVLQELWNRVASQAVDLVSETRDVVLEKDTFQQFSSSISELSTLLLALDAKKVEAAMGSEFTKSALETLNGQLKKARKIVKDYKSGSRLRLLLHSHSILLQMQELAKEIAKTISSFQLVNLDMALNLKTMTELVINNLTSMELRSATATETIAFEIENSISQNNRNRENSVKLLEKIADAVGASANASLVQNELARLRQEKEEMEDQKNQAEALQLSQLIQLLYSTEIVTRPQNEDCPTYQQKHPITSFVCPLCNEIMADPVAIFCGHSFERKAIQDYFNRGEKNCPTCREELPSLELTPNVNLRSSIEEWKRREMDLTFQAALSAINSNDHSKQNKALEDLQFLTEMPDNAIKVAEQGLIPKLVEFLKDSRLNTMATLKCLYFLAKNCDNHKEAIVEAGVVRRIVKQIYTGPQESRGWMADDLLKMQLKENRMKDLEDGQFIQSLIQMLSSNSSAYKLVCLKCIKKLTAYPRMAKRLLSDSATIPPLLGLISFISPDPNLKQEAGEILALLVGACQYPQFQMHQSLQELQSKHNISLFLQLVICSDPQIKFQFLHLLVELSHKSDIARSLIRSNGDAVAHLFSSLDGDEPLVKRWVLKLIHCISDGHPDGVPLPSSPGKETAINTLVAILTHSLDIEERRLAAGIISQLPKDDITIDDILHKSEALKAIREVICSMEEEDNGIRAPTNVDTSLLENALAALLRFTEPTKPEFRRQVGKLELYPSLVRVLSSGSSLAKKRTAIALAQLSQSTSVSVSDATIVANQANNSLPLLRLMNLFPNMPWCCSTSSEIENLCAVHGAACLHRHTFCLIKANAVKPLVRTLSDTETGVAEAALMALETLLTDNSSPSHATAAIVDSEGVVAILQLLEKGTLPAKTKALDLFHEIVKHKPLQISDQLFQRSERILVQLLQEDALKKKVGLVLRQMNIMPDQSSYF
ncbi:U-box domain-containing protein 44 isoform X2 [Hevea brasiliensis]|uniref:U-box domain-containing protein 44 isoform X2 n=1 Tax=Hevea brasiliensis TaxID=3981 RepID=UPI0025F1F807|nr:U-box domain-containing protein 44 isoform X2 [Hevea brasiliensis]